MLRLIQKRLFTTGNVNHSLISLTTELIFFFIKEAVGGFGGASIACCVTTRMTPQMMGLGGEENAERYKPLHPQKKGNNHKQWRRDR